MHQGMAFLLAGARIVVYTLFYTLMVRWARTAGGGTLPRSQLGVDDPKRFVRYWVGGRAELGVESFDLPNVHCSPFLHLHAQRPVNGSSNANETRHSVRRSESGWGPSGPVSVTPRRS